MRATARPRVRLVDVLLACAFLGIGIAGTAPAGLDQPAARSPDAVAYALVVISAVAIVAWRPYPLHVLVVTGAALVPYLLLEFPFGPILFPAAFAVGAVAATRPHRLTVVVVGVDALIMGLALLVRLLNQDSTGFEILTVLIWTTALWFVAPLAVGSAWRIRAQANKRIREEQARRTVTEERLHLAQEVHDVVGHGLAVIAMQAGVGLHVLDRSPEKARDALQAIRETSKESLEGLRVELAALRGQPNNDPQHSGRSADDISALIDRVRAGGLPVTFEIEDVSPSAGEPVGLAAYRIVQESLTNVLRHAGPDAGARVRVRVVRGHLLIEIHDSGHGPPHGGPIEGSGIHGMRERAAALGGTVHAAGYPKAGFTVRACLPIPTAKRASEA